MEPPVGRRFGEMGSPAWRAVALTAAAVAAALAPWPGAAPVWAQLPTAQLHAVFPAGGQQGTSVEVALSGVDLDGAVRLMFSHPGITAAPKMAPPAPPIQKEPQPVPGQFTVAIAADVPPGLYEVRAVGRFGASNPRAFSVEQLPEVREPADNHSLDKASPITIGSVVNGTADAALYDYFKIALRQGQRVIVDCWAERIDSRLDATLAIYDAAGRELARDRDTSGRDPLLVFTAPADGEYVVQLYDFTYGGGSDRFYRLIVRGGPYVDSVFPPVALPGAKTPLTIYGSGLPGGTPAEGLSIGGRTLEQLTVEIEAPAGAAAENLDFASLVRPGGATLDGFEYRLSGEGGAANPRLIALARGPVVVEQEPNDDPAHPQAVTVPCDYVGRFHPRGDYDYLSFEAKKGDDYWVDVVSQRLGLKTDPYLLVQRLTKNDKGEVQAVDIQELDDAAASGRPSFMMASGDPGYRFVAPEDGTYRVLIRNLYAAASGDPRQTYALSIHRPAPDFRLVALPVHHTNNTQTAAPVGALVRRGGTEMIDVLIVRRDGFDGPVQLEVEGLPAGVTGDRALLAAGQPQATIVLRATEDAAAWTGPVRVVGRATIAGQTVARTARAGATEWPAAENQIAEARQARDLTLAVLDLETMPFVAELGEQKSWDMSRAGKLEIPVKLVRRGEFKLPVILSPIGLPGKVKAPALTIAPEASDGKLALEIAGDAAPGEYAIRLQAQATISYSRDPQAAATAAAHKQEVEKIAAELAAAAAAAEQARVAADKAATDSAALAKQTDEALAAATQKAAAEAELAKGAVEKAAAARAAAEKDAQNQDLAQARQAAEKAAADAQTAAQAAGEARAGAEKAAAAAGAQLKAATDDKAAKDKAATGAATLAKTAADAKAAAEKRAAELAKAAEAKNVNVFESSTSTILKITAAPLELSVAPAAAAKPGGQAAATIKLNRLYGFADAVEVELLPPAGVAGLAATKVAIAAGQNEAPAAIALAAETPPGKHTFTARAKFAFNGQAIEVDQPLTIEVEAAQ